MQTARYYLLYSISFILYYLTAPIRLSSRLLSEKSPEKRKKKIFTLVAIVAIAIIATAVTIGQFSLQQQQHQNQGAANVKFMTFEVDKQEIAVGESTNVLINVRNSEDKVIDDAKVVITIEPSGYGPYLSISNGTIQIADVSRQRCKDRGSQRFYNCHSISRKRSSVCCEGDDFCEGYSNRHQRISFNHPSVE